jgi:hypothetical protein
MNSLSTKLKQWLSTNGHFGLMLQTGWFGRPHDNFHSVTNILERPNKFIVEIDEQLYLIFTKPLEIEQSGDDLVFGKYRQLTFDYQSFDDMNVHCSLYGQPGETTFVSYNKTES